MDFINESKRLFQKGESRISSIFVPLDVIGMPKQIRTGLALSNPKIYARIHTLVTEGLELLRK